MTSSIEDEIAAALIALDNPLPTAVSEPIAEQPLPRQDEHQEEGPAQELEPEVSEKMPSPEISSPTLEALEESRRPKAKTVCEHCPNSVWFSTPAEVKCYCRVMFLVTWSNKEPNQFTNCDGIYLGQEQ